MRVGYYGSGLIQGRIFQPQQAWFPTLLGRKISALPFTDCCLAFLLPMLDAPTIKARVIIAVHLDKLEFADPYSLSKDVIAL